MEIRWLAEKMGAKPATMSGPAGVGDIMLTCFVNLSRNRTVGVRLGAGEPLEVILGSGSFGDTHWADEIFVLLIGSACFS